MPVPKYGCHNLATPLLMCLVALGGFHHLLSTQLSSFKVCSAGSMFHLLSYTDTENPFYLAWTGVSKRGTHFENNLRIPKDSYKIVNTQLSDIFKVSAISRNFNLRSPKTILWTFVIFSGTTADFGRPERSTSSVFVQPRLNSVYQSDCHKILTLNVWRLVLHKSYGFDNSGTIYMSDRKLIEWCFISRLQKLD